MMNDTNRLLIERTELTITHRCSLKCRLCGAYSPYYTPVPHWELEKLILYIDKYFEFVDYVEKLTLSGGEPFLHPELGELVEYLQKYIDRIGLLEFITNGTIVPAEKVLISIRKYGKVKIILDDYGPELSKKVTDIQHACNIYNIFCETRKYYGSDAYYHGWIDMSDLSDKKRTLEEDIQIYQNCIFSKKFKRFLLVDGKIYLCAAARRCDTLGVLHRNEDYIDIVCENISIQEKKNKIRTFFERDCFEACAFCVGFNDSYERHEPGEQLDGK